MGGRGASSSNTINNNRQELAERLLNAKTQEEAYRIMREGYKENTRNSKLTNRNDMINYIKQQTNIDITRYIEEKAGGGRTYLGVHLEEMPINDRNTIRNLMARVGVRINDNGGYGYALYYKKKS